MSERAAFYARVSSLRQEQEQTIDSQLAALELTASALGLVVSKEHRYIDDGYTGSDFSRPALDALRDASADGLIDVVFIHSPDRLARRFVHQYVVLEEFSKRSVRVHFVENRPGERPEDRLLVQMQGAFAEYEREKIMERTRRGRLHKVRTAKIPPFSEAPFGYSIVRTPGIAGGTVVINEIEAELVREVYRWYIDGDPTVRVVSERLNAQPVKPRRANRWRRSAVHKMLTWPAYCGTAFFGRRESVEPIRPKSPGKYRRNLKSSCRLRPKEQWIMVPIPAIVEEATQAAVKAKLAKNKIWSPRKTKLEYLLRGLAVCGECGKKMACDYRRGGGRKVTPQTVHFVAIRSGRITPDLQQNAMGNTCLPTSWIPWCGKPSRAG